MERKMDGTLRLEPGVADQVIAILAEQAMLDPAQITRAATLEELGLDSLGLVESLFAIEETFNIAVPFNANDPAAQSDGGRFDLSSVGAIIDGVEALLAAR